MIVSLCLPHVPILLEQCFREHLGVHHRIVRSLIYSRVLLLNLVALLGSSDLLHLLIRWYRWGSNCVLFHSSALHCRSIDFQTIRLRTAQGSSSSCIRLWIKQLTCTVYPVHTLGGRLAEPFQVERPGRSWDVYHALGSWQSFMEWGTGVLALALLSGSFSHSIVWVISLSRLIWLSCICFSTESSGVIVHVCKIIICHIMYFWYWWICGVLLFLVQDTWGAVGRPTAREILVACRHNLASLFFVKCGRRTLGSSETADIDSFLCLLILTVDAVDRLSWLEVG